MIIKYEFPPPKKKESEKATRLPFQLKLHDMYVCMYICKPIA